MCVASMCTERVKRNYVNLKHWRARVNYVLLHLTSLMS